jgi:hypothetical protein
MKINENAIKNNNNMYEAINAVVAEISIMANENNEIINNENGENNKRRNSIVNESQQ